MTKHLQHATESRVAPDNVDFDDYSDTYSDAVNKSVSFSGLDVDFFTKVKADYIVDIARKYFDDLSKTSLLDVGCGVGNFHPLLTPHFSSIHGIDVSERSIEEAKARNSSVNYQHYDGSIFPCEDNTYDLAVGICVMHHVRPDAWPLFAQEMRRVIRPGGLVLIFEHNPYNPLTNHVVNNCPFDEDAVLLRSSRTRKLYEEAGFAHVDARFILSIPAANGILRSLDRLFAKLPAGAQYYVSAQKPT